MKVADIKKQERRWLRRPFSFCDSARRL